MLSYCMTLLILFEPSMMLMKAIMLVESRRLHQAAAESENLEVPNARQAKSVESTMLQRPHKANWSPAKFTLP